MHKSNLKFIIKNTSFLILISISLLILTSCSNNTDQKDYVLETKSEKCCSAYKEKEAEKYCSSDKGKETEKCCSTEKKEKACSADKEKETEKCCSSQKKEKSCSDDATADTKDESSESATDNIEV